MGYSVVILGVTFLVSYILLKLFVKYGFKLGFVDIPNHRSTHSDLKLRGAGLGFLLASLVSFIFIVFKTPEGLSIDGNLFKHYLIFLICMTGIGVADDILNTSAKFRLFLQFFFSFLFVGSVTHGFTQPVSIVFLPFDSGLLSYLFCILYLVWVINLFNFMDGIDGIAGLQAFIWSLLSVGLCFIGGAPFVALLYAIVGISLIPFLIGNWAPARYFMGDGGAYFLGAFFAATPLVLKVEFQQSLISFIILMALFVSDATVTLIMRILNKKNPLKGHRTYGFHKLLLDFNWSHSKISIIYALMTIVWCLPLSILTNSIKPIVLLYIAYVPFISLFLLLGVGRESKARSMESET